MKHSLFFKFLLVLTLLFGANSARALTTDSTTQEKILSHAVRELKNLVAENTHLKALGKTQEMRFVLEITPNGVVTFNEQDVLEDYIIQKTLEGHRPFIEKATLRRELNNRLRQVFVQNGIETYLLLINAFDISLQASLPDSLNVRDMLTAEAGSFFDEQTNVNEAYQVHEVTTWDIAGQVFKEDQPALLLSLGAYCGVFKPGEKHCYRFAKPQINYTPDASEERYKSVEKLIQTYFFKTTPRDNSNEACAEHLVSVLESAVSKGVAQAEILATETSEGIQEILKVFSLDLEWQNLTWEERIHCLKVLAAESMNKQAQSLTLKLLATCPKDEIPDLFAALQAGNDYHQNEALILDILDQVEADFFWQADSYEGLMAVLKGLMESSPAFGDQMRYVYSDPNLMADHFIIWDRDYTFSFLPAPENTKSYTVNLGDQGETKYQRYYLARERRIVGTGGNPSVEYQSNWVEEGKAVELNPFEPVILYNRSKLGSGEGELRVVPAISLKYLKDKEWDARYWDGAFITLDVVTLATGYGALAQASRLYKVWLLFEMSNATGNLLITGKVIEDDNFKTLVALQDVLVAGIGIKNLMQQAGKLDFKTAIQKLKSQTLEIKESLWEQARQHLTLWEQIKASPQVFKKIPEKVKAQIESLSEILKKEYKRLKGGDLRPTRQTNRLAQILSNEVFAKLNKEAREIINKLDDEALRKLAQDIQDNPELKDQWIEIWNTFSKAKPVEKFGPGNQWQAIYNARNKIFGENLTVDFYGEPLNLGSFKLTYEDLGLGYSGVMNQKGELGWKITYDKDKITNLITDKIKGDPKITQYLRKELADEKGIQPSEITQANLLDEINRQAKDKIARRQMLDRGIAQYLELNHKQVFPRRGSHSSYEKYLKTGLKEPLFAFALNLEKNSSGKIEIGFFSGTINASHSGNKALKVTKSSEHPRLKGILKTHYQEMVLKQLTLYFGSSYSIQRKIDNRGGKDIYW